MSNDYITFYNEYDNYEEYKEIINKKYNVISVSVFRLENNYKNEFVYTNGLELLLNKFEKYFPDFYLRVYYDNSVLDYDTPNKKDMTLKIWEPLFNKLRKNKKVQLVKYEMKQFKKDKIHHHGLIGTLVRLYPLFDIDINKNINDVFISDIDVNIKELERYSKNYHKVNNNNFNFFYETFNCYDLQERFKIMRKHFEMKFPILAGTIISKMKFPIEILNKFFHCVLNFNIDEECEYYKTFDNFIYQGNGGIKVKNSNEKYKYGIDEIFTLLMKKYLYKYKIKHLIFIRDNSLTKPLYDLYKKYEKNDITEKQFKNILLYLLGNNFDKQKSLKDNYDIIDKVIYEGISHNELNERVILNRAKQLINDIVNNKLDKKDYGFDDFEIDCIINTDNNGAIYYVVEYSSQNKN